MPTIPLKYGTREIPFEFDAERFDLLAPDFGKAALTDVEIGDRFDAPIGSQSLEEIVSPGESVLIVVPDATRQTASGQIVNLLVRRLIANGTLPYEIKIVFATGIHRRVTDAEKSEILTPFIAQRITTLDHDARDLMKLAGLDSSRFAEFGEVAGAKIELSRALVEHDRVIIVGGVSFHYFAGFTGGRKLICPGLASASTIAATHRLAFDFESKARARGVGAGLLDGNPVHEAFDEICALVGPAFSVTTIVDEHGAATDVFAGDWRAAHRAACDEFSRRGSVRIEEKRELVVVSCGGSPHDINLIQAHKALDAASHACADGGTIVLAAACDDGLGRADFLKWFESPDSAALAERLGEGYEVNGQTAWALLQKAERFDVRIVTGLKEDEVSLTRMKSYGSLEDALRGTEGRRGYIMPFGAKTLVRQR